MLIHRLGIHDFRNIREIELKPAQGVNLIYGENAQGKTNLLEAIWLCTGCRSFRGARDADLTRLGASEALIELDHEAFGVDRTETIKICRKREAFLNGRPVGSASKLLGEFSAVIFSPQHLSMIQNGPAERRGFLDTALCLLKPAYASYTSAYERVLRQRNTLLKDIPLHSELLDTLDVWDEKLIEAAQVLTYQRSRYVETLLPYASDIYSGITGGGEQFSLRYVSSFLSYADTMRDALRLCRKKDIELGSTHVGPHLDDLSVEIDGLSARTFGSQGQQRSAALALKTAEAEVLHQITGEYPIVLLDDVMSELDAGRQRYVLEHIQGKQVFITCCDPDAVARATVEKKWHVKSGAIVEN